MSVQAECDSDPDSQIPLLDSIVLKQCGVIFFDLFTRFKNNEMSTDDCDSSVSTTSYSIGHTYMDLHMGRTFDRLYDMMSHYLENVDISYQSSPKELYDYLNVFMQNVQLHDINRYSILVY